MLAIPLVARTFATNPAESRELLRAVVAVIGEPDFPIQCIDRLADEDAAFTADDGTVGVWMLRLIGANGKRRMFASLLHGTMAGGFTTAKELSWAT